MAIRSVEEFRQEQERRKQEHYRRGRVKPEALARAVPTWPTTSTNITQGAHETHNAIDVGGSIGNPIFAVKDGTISAVKYHEKGYGVHIIMRAADGMEHVYAHLSGVNVKVGQKVRAGQTIGALGSTGNSTGPHLHFEVRDPSQPVVFPKGWTASMSAINPLTYLGMAYNVLTGAGAPATAASLIPILTAPATRAAKGVAKGVATTVAKAADGEPLFDLEIPLFTVIQGTFFPSEEQKAEMKEKGIATFPVSMLTGGIGVILVIIALWQISAPERKKLADLGMEAAQIAKAAAV